MKVAAIFPGYSSQFVGMAKKLYDESRIVQEHFEQASNCLDMNFVKLCFASSDIELTKMRNAHPALFLVSTSIFDLIQSEGVEVDLVAGYNIGHYAAMHATGILSLPDGLYLINKYVSMYEALLKEAEFAFVRVEGIKSEQLEKLCKKFSTKELLVQIAVYDSYEQHIIAGHAQAVSKLVDVIIDLEGTTELIGPEVGLHSSLMEPIAQSFRMYLEKVDFKDGIMPILCTSDAKEVRHGKDVKECTISWVTQPVRWAQMVDKLKDYDLLIEIGPGTQLRGMLEPRYPDKKIIAINKRSDINKLKRMLDLQDT